MKRWWHINFYYDKHFHEGAFCLFKMCLFRKYLELSETIFKEMCSILCGFESSYCTDHSFRLSIRLDTMTEHFGRCPWIIVKYNEAEDSCAVKFERVNTEHICDIQSVKTRFFVNTWMFVFLWVFEWIRLIAKWFYGNFPCFCNFGCQ